MNAKAALPSLFTISSLFCGFLSMYYAVNGRFIGAALLIVIATEKLRDISIRPATLASNLTPLSMCALLAWRRPC